MLEFFKKAIFFFATTLVVFLPTFSTFFYPKPHAVHHVILHKGDKLSWQRFNHAGHNNSWNLIKNSQLTSPPAPLKLKNTPVTDILFAICFITLALSFSKIIQFFRVLKVHIVTLYQRYLVFNTLLI
jgi:hypothetical protein